MPEPVSAGLAVEAATFALALPASVEMPAGTGKTHLLSATAKHIVQSEGRVLVLTHTNAGVYAIKARLRRLGVVKGVQVSTITSFAFRLARCYPELGLLRVPKVMVPAHSTSYVAAATLVASSRHIRRVLAASFTHVLVDEYQDCNETQHAFVSALRAAVPATGVLGDPLQAIFGFNDRLADWASVLAEYPPLVVDIKPHRWAGHNEALGEWLLTIRPRMVPGHIVNWSGIALPPGVTFENLTSNHDGLLQAASADYPSKDTVLIIAGWPNTARTIAGDLNGTFTVMEELAGRFMSERLSKLIATAPEAYALWLFDLTKSCCSGQAALDMKLRNRYVNGRTAIDLVERGPGTRAGAELAIGALDSVVMDPSLSSITAAMDVLSTSSALRLHSHEAWYDVQTSIRGALVQDNDKGVLLEELAKARDGLRYAGRGERKRLISRNLLVKGLEFDHVIIAEVGEHAKVNDLYVALSRARKSIAILGRSSTLRLQASPNGR